MTASNVVRDLATETVISRSAGWKQWPLTVIYSGIVIFFGLIALNSIRHSIVFEKTQLGVAFLILPFVVFDWMFYHSMADEVAAGTNYLVIRVGSESDVVPLNHILDVTRRSRGRGYPERITLRLDVPGKFGKILRFIPTKTHRASWPQTPMTRFILKREES